MDIISPKWTGRLLKMAKDVANWSKDDSTKVGAVITTSDGGPISWGFNGMPMNINDSIPERNERPAKYKWYAHAEQNAIDLAGRNLEDAVMFVTFFPCAACARSIIQHKIRTIVVDEMFTADKMPQRWQDDMNIAVEMLQEAGVTIIAAKPDAPA
jgi:dCMP deaminase